jgi:hypothetical protein
MRRVVSVEAKAGHKLSLVFDDGTKGTISVADRLFGPMFEPLKDPKFFAQVRVDEFGAVCWPNDADLAPDALYRKVTYH